jgi:hypothetical protein
MKKSLAAMSALLTALLAFIVVTTAFAQDTTEVPPVSYYLAADANGVQQVYQLVLDGEYQARPITYAESDVITFSPAYDGLGVAYISDGQLWLQSLHTEAPEAVVSVGATQFFSTPVWSQEGQYIAYADNGVWLLDLGTRETRQLLADVPLEEGASNAGEFRIYQPEMFVLGEDGTAEKLIVDVGVWEWNTVGVYDLASGELQELENQIHTDLLPLSDGRVLLYGNGGVGGEFALHMADSLEDINTYTRVLDFAALTDQTLFAEQAVEIEPGVVRVFGSTISPTPDEVSAFYFDFDATTGEADNVNFIPLSEGSTGNTVAGQLSPDGSIVPVHLSALWTDAGSIYGELNLVELATGETVAQEFPEVVGLFRWQE